jgi:hypothetical protein
MYALVPGDVVTRCLQYVLVLSVLTMYAWRRTWDSDIIWASVQPDARDSFDWTYMDKNFQQVPAGCCTPWSTFLGILPCGCGKTADDGSIILCCAVMTGIISA